MLVSRQKETERAAPFLRDSVQPLEDDVLVSRVGEGGDDRSLSEAFLPPVKSLSDMVLLFAAVAILALEI